MNQTSIQYCNNCKNTVNPLHLAISVMESCPFCGTRLSATKQKSPLPLFANHPDVVFKKASSLPKLTLDISKLDKTLHFLTPNNRVCISGIHTQKLIERICVRAQLPHRYGGLDSNVLFVDGANSSDLYMCVNFAQQYGLDSHKILEKIISSRAFTAYQLADTIINKVPLAIKQHNANILVITNLLNYFITNLNADTTQMKAILKEIVKSLSKIQNCMIVISLGFATQYDYLLSKLFTRAIHIEQSYNTLSVQINDNGKKNSVILKKDELETIPQH